MSCQITITAAGHTTTLGDDSVGDWVTVNQREHVRQVVRDGLAFGTAESTRSGGNIRNTIGFLVDKTFVSADLALAYLADLDALPGQGVLTWIVGNTMRVMSDATLDRVTMVSLSGENLVMSYLFTGGLIGTGVVSGRPPMAGESSSSSEMLDEQGNPMAAEGS